MREILLVAGEASGDAHAAGVARALAAAEAPYTLVGVGGNQMGAAGVDLLAHVEQLAVMGFIAPIRYLGRHWRLLRALRARLEAGCVAAVVLIDYPDFNMLVAAAAARLGVPVLYYITPQVWAWRRGRLTSLARTVTKAAVILPFEEPLLREHGIDATFVGHPLLDRAVSLPDSRAARASLGIDAEAPLLALFPGSRRQEIAYHLAPFVATARELQRRIPGLQVVVSHAPHVVIDPAICPFPLVSSASFTILRAANVALCKSGTTTLEATVAGCPFVVGYRTHPINYAAAKYLVRIPDISLVNVLAGRRLVPEFIQAELEPGAIAATLERLCDPASTERRAMLAGLGEVRAMLGEPGAADHVARLAMGLAGSPGSPPRAATGDSAAVRALQR